MVRQLSLALTLVSLTAFTFAGCNSPQAESENPSAAADGQRTGHAHDHDHGHDHEHADNSPDAAETDEIKAELAKLSPEDRAAAEQQRVCPVSGEMLGSMGPPLKVEVDGRDVWVCCAGCQDPVRENPEEYLAKLESQ